MTHTYMTHKIATHKIMCHTVVKYQRTCEHTWNDFILSNKNSIISELIDLSLNQKRVVNCLAHQPTTEIRGKDFLLMAKIPASTAAQAVESLESKNIVFKDEQGVYRLLDPAVKSYILQNT